MNIISSISWRNATFISNDKSLSSMNNLRNCIRRQYQEKLSMSNRRRQRWWNGQHKLMVCSKYIEKMTVDLTERAREGHFDPVIGREVELDRMEEILIKRITFTKAVQENG